MRIGTGKPWHIPIERKGTNSIKWDAMGSILGKDDMKPFWVADMDFESSEAIIIALKQRAAHGIFGYTSDDPDALDAFCKWVDKRHGIFVDPSWVLKSPGVVTGIGLAINAYTKPGEGIVIQPPVYPQFAEMTEVNERELINNPIQWVNGRPEMDFEHLENCLKNPNAKLMILCNPHNPIGRVWEKEVIQKVVTLCEENDVVLFSDEIHSDLLFSGVKFHSALESVKKESSKLVVAMAPSKTFNIAGLFYSLIIIPDKTQRELFQKVVNKLHLFPVNCFNEEAARAAYSSSEAWLDSLLVYLEDNYKALKVFFETKMPEVIVTPMEGTYLAWLDFRALIPDGLSLKKFMMNEANIAVNDGRAFGIGGEGFVRFNFGCPREVMLEGLNDIVEAYQKRKG